MPNDISSMLIQRIAKHETMYNYCIECLRINYVNIAMDCSY